MDEVIHRALIALRLEQLRELSSDIRTWMAERGLSLDDVLKRRRP